MKVDTARAFADNVQQLMWDRGDSQLALAKRAGISQRAVGDVVTYGRGHFKNPTLKTVDGIARAYDVPAWAMLLPGAASQPEAASELPRLVEVFQRLPAEGRMNILRALELEARYAVMGARVSETGS